MLAPGGYALLHVPHSLPSGMAVCADAPIMQMHAIPAERLRARVAEAGCEVLAADERVDFCGGGIGNAVYVVRKPGTLARWAAAGEVPGEASPPQTSLWPSGTLDGSGVCV